MKKVLIVPALAAVLFAVACSGEGGGPTAIDPTAVGPKEGVRFFNAMRAMTGAGGFTMNGQFVSGSVVGSGQSTATCATVNAGSTSIGFGAANTGGTGLSGNPLATLNNQSIAASGNYTVAAAGSGVHALLFLLDNSFSGSLGTNQAAVRFVNLAPSMNPFSVLSGTTQVASNLALGSPTVFTTVTGSSNAYTVSNGSSTVISGSAGTLSLQPGSVNTIAIVPGATAGSFQLVNVPRC